MTKDRNLPELLRAAERRLNGYLFHDKHESFASIPANRDRDLDLLLYEAADEIERLSAKWAPLSGEGQRVRVALGLTPLDIGGDMVGAVNKLHAKIERLQSYLLWIKSRPDESNEWDAVDLFRACRDKATSALEPSAKPEDSRD